jgi:hypothetical protein
MSLEICRCCAGKMTTASPRNPNICVSCEQLLEDDCMALDMLLASVAEPERQLHRIAHAEEIFVDDLHGTFSGSV